jgi:hypothetical protein
VDVGKRAEIHHRHSIGGDTPADRKIAGKSQNGGFPAVAMEDKGFLIFLQKEVV